MHIDVKHILAADVGDQTSFNLSGETPSLTEAPLTQPIEGELRLMRTDFGLLSSGRVSASLRLECHRCLSTFSCPVKIDLSGEFQTQPQPDQWPISSTGQIDIEPLVSQELVLAAPIKQLCQPDCPGLCHSCGQRQNQGHQHRQVEIRHQPRITNH